MLHSQDLINHLKQQGFTIESSKITDSLSSQLKDIESSNIPFIQLPFIQGLKNINIPVCHICNKQFINKSTLNKHFVNVHNVHDNSTITNSVEDVQIENGIPTQYQIFNGDFIQSETYDGNGEENFYVVLKIDNCFDGLNNKNSSFENRRIRKAETKPRKVYERLSSVTKTSSDKVNIFTGPFNCVQCSDVFETCCSYSKHFHDEHSKRKTTIYKCQICENKFYNANETSTKISNTIIHCGECNQTFESAEELTKHKEEEHKNEVFQCDVKNCSKIFSSYIALHRHSKIHSGIRPYVCPIESCAKSFTQKSGLDQHTRTHTSQRPYSCVICLASFRQSAHLVQHMRTHSLIQPYACSYCPMKFRQSSHLKNHVVVTHSTL